MIETPQEILSREASTAAAQSFIQWRKALKKPLTERAAALIAQSLRLITSQGGCADDALALAEEHGWRTVKPEWYWRQRPRQPLTVINGGRNGAQEFDSQAGFAARNAGIEQGSVAAGFRRTPQKDCF